jgi:hypothetical protein
MASDASRRRFVARLALPAAIAAACSVGAAAAAEPTRNNYIFQCELNGKKVTSDRLIPECANKEQRQLNPDGSLNRIIPPTPTADERAEMEQKQRDADAKRVADNDAVRRDRNLMQRFPNETDHNKARAKALDDIRASVKSSEARIALLLVEKKKLDDEKQFYINDHVNKPLPNLLKQKVDANEATLEAQKALVQNQQTEIGRIDRLYDLERDRLRALWKGAPPGSLGPAPGPQAATPIVKTSSQ